MSVPPRSVYFTLMLFIFSGIGLIFAPSLSAHPHMFIDSSISFSLSEEKLEGFWIEWGFDEVFSAMIIQDYDRNGNGSLSEKEQRKIREGAFSNLRNHHYFTYVINGDETFRPKKVESFSAWLDEGRLYYRFFVPYKMSVEMEPKTIRVAIYDKSFYCAIATEKNNPVRVHAPDSLKTEYEVKKEQDLKITYSPQGGRSRGEKNYTGVAYPDQIKLSFHSADDGDSDKDTNAAGKIKGGVVEGGVAAGKGISTTVADNVTAGVRKAGGRIDHIRAHEIAIRE